MNEIKAIFYIFGVGMCLTALYYSQEIKEWLLINTPTEIQQFITLLLTA